MTQTAPAEKLMTVLLQSIDPKEIADESLRQTIELLLNLIEQLNSKVKDLVEENQKLRDENNRLKGEQGKPDIKANKNIGFQNDHSSEKERKVPTKHSKSSKNATIKVDREEIDQTGARVGGVNHTTNIICNPLYTVYLTTKNKDRLSVLKVLQNVTALEFILNEFTYELLDTLNLPTKWNKQLKELLPQETVFTEIEFNALLDEYLSKLSFQYRTRVQEAAAIAFYHQQTNIPLIKALVCDDAPQFKLLTADLALCWVHEARHYKKLSPFVACHRQSLDEFLDDFWKYYRKLLAYRDFSSQDKSWELREEFWTLFSTVSGYEQLDERKRLTAAKISELLLVLDHPELPLHNNPAELAARTMVQRCNISYATQTTEGTKAWDIFMSLVSITRKLEISFFEYMRDRISQIGNIPSLRTIIRGKSVLNPFGWSWMPE
ncbi:IS66 family transposase [Nostoc sp.]|uniref:IS66 family transposase n=1 Tax=Nostoc sp. TaxID=1180 RepID=UPI002FF197A0